MEYFQQLVKGVTEPLLLYLINEIPMYGYQITKELKKRTAGYLKLKGGTVYPALQRLESKGLVTSRWQQITLRQRRKYYQITEKGQQFLVNRLADWKEFSTAVTMLLEKGKA